MEYKVEKILTCEKKIPQIYVMLCVLMLGLQWYGFSQMINFEGL